MLVLTLILDDDDTKKFKNGIWNIYYHFFLDSDDVKLLHTQAKCLLDLSSSHAQWRQGKYGKTIRFCSQSTLEALRKIWKSFLSA